MSDAAAAQPERVVGVGASAGGLEALRVFFGGFEATSRSAFVVLQHLKPDVRSYMVELLARDTALEVRAIEPGLKPEAGRIHVCPPGRGVTLDGGVFVIDDAPRPPSNYRPIDALFTSLAEACGPRTVGVVLSGTGNDGAAGVRAIAEVGGLVLAQDPGSAQFEDMPRNAATTGCVDFVVPPIDMAGLIDGDDAAHDDARLMARLAARLLAHTQLDVRGYKSGTLRRRIERRIHMLDLGTLEAYVQFVADHPAELDNLASEVLIGVTGFFRDPQAWRSLEEQLPAIIDGVSPDEALRVWSVGCSTGQEAYSLACAIRWTMNRIGAFRELRIFATDINRRAIDRASTGLFSDAELAEVPDDRRTFGFVAEGDGWRVRPELRRCIVFARHDALTDPPFTRLHLAVCRNLLIYLEPSHQRVILRRLAQALRLGGVLFLGASESVDALEGAVEALDERARLHRKTADLPPLAIDHRPARRAMLTSPLSGAPPRSSLDSIYRAAADALGICIFGLDAHDRVVYSTGPIARLVRLRSGVTSTSIFDLLTPPLDGVVRRILRTHRNTEATVRDPRLEAAGVRSVRVSPAALGPTGEAEPLMLRIHLSPPDPTRAVELSTVEDETVAGLRDELALTQQTLQASNEELVAANEELQATNEELIASNEELQATNEELHSVNEELHSVNAEFQLKLLQLSQAKADLDHVLGATQVAVIFLDGAQRIRRYTGNAARWFDLMPQDIGRPFAYFQLPIIGDVRQAVDAVFETGEASVMESPDGRYMVRLLPIESDEGGGVVITVADAHGFRPRQRVRADAFDGMPYAVALVDHAGRIVDVNAAWRSFSIENGGPPDGFLGQSYLDACRGESDSAEAVARGLVELIEGRSAVFQQVYPCHAPERRRWFLMHASRLAGEAGVVVAHIDVTSTRAEERDDRRVAEGADMGQPR